MLQDVTAPMKYSLRRSGARLEEALAGVSGEGETAGPAREGHPLSRQVPRGE